MCDSDYWGRKGWGRKEWGRMKEEASRILGRGAGGNAIYNERVKYAYVYVCGLWILGRR